MTTAQKNKVKLAAQRLIAADACGDADDVLDAITHFTRGQRMATVKGVDAWLADKRTTTYTRNLISLARDIVANFDYKALTV